MVFLGELGRLEGAGQPFVCITIIAARGSVPQEVGAKLLVSARGRECGTIGGGRIEEAAIARARELLAAKKSPRCATVEWNLQRDVGMTCGGVVTLLLEVFNHEVWRVAIFGAGHVAQALTRALSVLRCRIQVIDSRKDWLDALPKLPNVEPIFSDPLEAAVKKLPDGAFVALMTQGHRTDKPVLECILKTRSFPYLGVIGSASKAAVLRRELKESGLSPAKCRAFRCPLGLPLGNDEPEEIALSIAAEMVQVRGTTT